MYELIKLIEFASARLREGQELALATIIHTVGSSYRKQGTQMMIAGDLSYEGALSGGCVEKEVLRQSQTVFSTRQNVVFEYDGRYKLGCNGRIFILVEFLAPETLHKLSDKIRRSHETREPFTIRIDRTEVPDAAHVTFDFKGDLVAVSRSQGDKEGWLREEVLVSPQFQLVILGGEYDSTTLANIASKAGLHTFLIAKELPSRRIASEVVRFYAEPDALTSRIRFDEQTAIVIMTHSLSKDLAFLREMMKVPSCYLGVLGPDHRKKTILNDLMNVDEAGFFACQDKLQELKGPVGINIGAVTPEEISVSILAEVIASLRDKTLTRQSASQVGRTK